MIGSSLTLAYLIAAPGAVNPAAPGEAAAAGSCTPHGKTLSVRSGGGRYFVPRCDYYFQNLSASASCGTVSPSSFYGYLVTRFDADSCLGPATFPWQGVVGLRADRHGRGNKTGLRWSATTFATTTWA